DPARAAAGLDELDPGRDHHLEGAERHSAGSVDLRLHDVAYPDTDLFSDLPADPGQGCHRGSREVDGHHPDEHRLVTDFRGPTSHPAPAGVSTERTNACSTA